MGQQREMRVRTTEKYDAPLAGQYIRKNCLHQFGHLDLNMTANSWHGVKMVIVCTRLWSQPLRAI